MDEPRRLHDNATSVDVTGEERSLIAAWRDAKAAPDYREEAGRQAASAAEADVEDRVMEWIAGVAAEAWDDL